MGKAENVEGWLLPDEIPWLREQGRKARVMVEVGSWKGKSATALLEESPGILFCVDHHQGSPGEEELFHEVQTGVGQLQVREQFLDNVREFREAGRLFLVPSDSVGGYHYLSLILQHTLADLVFIDADHRYESCRRDILSYQKLVRSGGILCGHNMDYDGVSKAVRELLPCFYCGPGTLWFANL